MRAVERWAARRYWLTRGTSDGPSLSFSPLFTIHQPRRPWEEEEGHLDITRPTSHCTHTRNDACRHTRTHKHMHAYTHLHTYEHMHTSTHTHTQSPEIRPDQCTVVPEVEVHHAPTPWHRRRQLAGVRRGLSPVPTSCGHTPCRISS